MGRFDPFSRKPDSAETVGASAVFVLGSQAFKNILQITQMIILGRMLGPETFGLIAMAGPLLALALLLQDLGLTQVTIQRQSLNHDESSLLFWYGVLFSFLICGTLVAAAPLVGRFYGDDRVGQIAMVMGPIAFLAGLGAQHCALLTRGMKFRFITIIECLASFVGFGGALCASLALENEWGIVVGMALYPATSTVLYWLVVDWRPSGPSRLWQKTAIMNFGYSVAIANVLNFITRNVDNVLIGRFYGAVDLGLYDRAYKLLTLPLQAISNPMARVMVPALARLQDQPEAYRTSFLKGYRAIVFLMLPGVCFMFASSHIFIPALFGQDWVGSIGIFQALTLAAFLQPINNPSGWLLLSQGRGKEILLWGIFSTLTSLIGILFGLPFGATGVALGYAGSELIRTPILWVVVGRSGPVAPRDVSRIAIPALFASIGSCLSCSFVLANSDTAPAIALAFAFTVTFAAFGLMILTFAVGRESLQDFKSLMVRFGRAKR